MDEIAHLLTAHGGALDRADFLDAGVRDSVIYRAHRRGLITRIRFGTYVMTSHWRSLTDTERHAVLVRSVLDKLGPAVVASHHSAAILHGLDVWGVDLDTVHLTRLDGRTGRYDSGVCYHSGALDERDAVRVGGYRCVSPARAVIESALISGTEQAMVVASSYLAGGGDRDDLLELFHQQFRSWPGSGAADVGLGLADRRYESLGEVRSGYFFWSHAIRRPDLQVVVRDERGACGRVDFAWERYRHVGEFDGLMKYGRLNPDAEDPGAVVAAEKLREDRIRAQGYGMTRWTWGDLSPQRSAALAARLKADLDASRVRAPRVIDLAD